MKKPAPRPSPKTRQPVIQSSPVKGLARLLQNPLLACFILVTLTLCVYLPVRQFEFINYDDQDYVSENYHVLAGLTWSGVAWAFGTGHASNWHPVTWLSHMLDIDLFGPNAGGPHGVNLFFHAANTVLLFLLLRRLTRTQWRSASVAALFALHPLHVESVAWVSERKDVLSTFFGFLSLVFYASYASRNTAVPARNPKLNFALAWCFLALGLMSKPMLVTWPFLMLLLDLWPLQRASLLPLKTREWKKLLVEKMPFFALAVASSAVTFMVQQKGGAIQTLSGYSFSSRIANAFVSYVRYLGKTFWPANLAIPYPYPGTWPAVSVILAVALILGLCFLAVRYGRQRPYIFVGWFWFLGMLIPVIGLVQVGAQAMADRYTYVPLIGIFIVVIWGAADAVQHWRALKWPFALAGFVILWACAFQAAGQLSEWQNSGSLSSHAIAVTKNNDIAYSNLGNYLLEKGELDAALDNYQKALRLMWGTGDSPADSVSALIASGSDKQEEQELLLRANPQKLRACAEILNNLGTILSRKGKISEGMSLYRLTLRIRPDHSLAAYNLAFELAAQGDYAQAIPLYQAALRTKPDNVKIRNALSSALVSAGRVDDAIIAYESALQVVPGDADAHYGLGLALSAKGEIPAAIQQYETALRADPTLWEVHNILGSALVSQGKLDDGIQHFRLLLEKNPHHARAHENLGIALAMQGKLSEATLQLQESLQADPLNAKSHFNLGNVFAMQHQLNEAVEQYQATLRLIPDHPQAHCNLGAALVELGRRDEAIAHFKEALRLQPNYEAAKGQLRALGVSVSN